MVVETSALSETVDGTIADTLACWLGARYAVTASRLAEEAGAEGLDLPTLASLTADVAALRKGDHSAERLRIERERLEMERERDAQRMQVHFEEWLKQPGIVDRICDPKRRSEETTARLRELFGRAEPANRGLSAETLAQIEKELRML